MEPRDETAFRDAVTTGQESGLALYACRGRIGNSLQIGRRRADFPACHVGYDGREVQVETHDLLTAVWRDGRNGTLPPNSLNAGQEVAAAAEGQLATASLYVCRATHQQGVHIGQWRAGTTSCAFGFGGRQVTAAAYEVLQAVPWMAWVTAGCNIVSDGAEGQVPRFEVLMPRWVRVSSGVMPVAAFPGGRENGTVQYPCRALAGGAMQIGKAGPALAGCHIGVQGTEAVVREFEVLAR